MAIEWFQPEEPLTPPVIEPGKATVQVTRLPEDAYIVFKELNEESDRGAALLGVAYLDEQLKQLFRAKMLNEKIADELLGAHRPLATFSARIDVGYGLGWLGKSTYEDINLIRKIRNDFAHLHKPMSFSDSNVISKCSALKLPKTVKVTLTARDTFCWTVAFLALHFKDAAKTAARPEPGLDFFSLFESARKTFK